MPIVLTKTDTPQTHLEAFLSTLPKEMLIRIAVGLNGDLTKAQIATAAAKQEAATAKTELEARSAEFEEKYYGLDLQNRKLEKRHAFHVERIADLTKRLAQAEAALGVPCNDEWDSWADEANASRKSMEILLGDKPTAQEWVDWAEADEQRAKRDEANASRETLTRIFLTKTLD
jgi:hypothetical protein